MNLEILHNNRNNEIEYGIDVLELKKELDDFYLTLGKDINIGYNDKTRKIVVTAKNLTDWTQKEHERLCEQFHCKLFAFTKKEVTTVIIDYRFFAIYEYSNPHLVGTNYALEFPPKLKGGI